MYQFKEEINCDLFFRFPRNLVLSGKWAELPLASKSIYPVIGIHCDKHGHCFPSQETIAIMSGIKDVKTVRVGIEGLNILSEFSSIKRPNRRGQWHYEYKIIPPANHRGSMFPFYRSYVEGGNWAVLGSVSKAVYPVIKTFAYYDHEDCTEDDCPDYSTRDYDIANPDFEVVAEYAGVCLPSVKKAMVEIEKAELIDTDTDLNDGWRVHRLPKRTFKRDYLNNKFPPK